MKSDFIRSLLEKSKDYIVIADDDGIVVDIGHHFLAALKENNLTRDIASQLFRNSFTRFDQQQSVIIGQLSQRLHASPFSVLWQTTGFVVLIAEDRRQQVLFQAQVEEAGQREIQFREREERIHVLLDESSDPIFSFKADGTYLYVNKIFARTVHLKQEDIVGKRIWDVFAQEEADKRFAMVRKVFRSGQTDTIEVRVPLPTGDKYFLTTVKPVKGQDGEVVFIICISKDITELKQAHEEIVTLRGILPICAACKKIRDDKGYWQQIEEYISTHSEAQFTHGICPQCVKQLYPNIAVGKPGSK